jgi:hypothetical protein
VLLAGARETVIRRFRGEQADFLRATLAGDALSPVIDAGLLAPQAEVEGGYWDLSLRAEADLIVTRSFEWCAPIWAVAAVAVLDAWAVLLESGLTLWSVEPADIAFRGAEPVLANPATLAPASEASFRQGVAAFRRNFLLPIALICAGRGGLLRALLRGERRGLTGELARQAAIPNADELGSAPAGAPCGDVIAALRLSLESSAMPEPASDWLGYYRGDPPLVPDGTWDAKRSAVARMLAVLKPRRVLDVGSNTGWYSRLAASHGASVVALDSDEACTSRLYLRAREERIALLPLLCDVLDPAPGVGFDYGQIPSARARLGSELVMGLAITHHLILGRGLAIPQAIAALAGWTTRWLAVEFVGLEARCNNPYAASVPAGVAARYSLEIFLDALAKRFRDVGLVPGEPGTRRLILCEV